MPISKGVAKNMYAYDLYVLSRVIKWLKIKHVL